MKLVKSCKMLLLMAVVFMMMPQPSYAVESNSTSENVNGINAVTPQPVYVVEEVRHFKTSQYDIPPARYYVTRLVNGLNYEGFLNRASYANAGEYWIVTYEGYISHVPK